MATDVGAMFDRALAEPSLAHLGESLETARRLYGVGNYVYCGDLVGYLLQQHAESTDIAPLKAIYDELKGLALRAPDEDDGEAYEASEDDVELADDEAPHEGVKIVHSLGSGERISPRSKPSGHFGGAAARGAETKPRSKAPPPDDTPIVRAIDPRPAPIPPPRRVAPTPEASVEVEGRPVLPAWSPPPSPPRRDLPATRPPPEPPALRRGAGPEAPAPRPAMEVVRYQERALAPPPVIEGAPGRVAFAFAVGLLLGALAVVVLMDHYRAAVRPRFEGLGTRPIVVRSTPPTGGVRVIHAAAPAPRRVRESLPVTPPWPNTPTGFVRPQHPTVAPAGAYGASGDAYAPLATAAPVAASPPTAPRVPIPNSARLPAAAAPAPFAQAAAAPAPFAQAAAAPAPFAQAAAAPARAWTPPATRHLPPQPPVAAVARRAPAAAAPRTVAARPKKAKASPRKRRAKPAATKRPPATPTGHILVETRPASKGQVTVQLDGTPRGTAPLRLSVPPGVHEVQTTHGDGYPEMRMVRVESGGTARIVVPIAPQAP